MRTDQCDWNRCGRMIAGRQVVAHIPIRPGAKFAVALGKSPPWYRQFELVSWLNWLTR